MSDSTSHLALPYLLPSQAQKHVTHNEALRMLDDLVQLSVRDRDRTAPPEDPGEGDRHVVGDGASGEWSGWDRAVAHFAGGGWMRLDPRAGWRAWIEAEGALVVFDGTGWTDVTSSEQQNLTLLGLGTAADAANPFAAKLNGALWAARTAAEGGSGDLRYTLNKEAAANVLSILLQTGWSARAELGLIGDDNFVLKVSPDGTTWHDALVVDATTGTLQGYLQTAGGTVAGALGVGTESYAHINMNRTVAGGSFNYINLPPGAVLAIRDDATIVARFDAAGPSSPGAETALTREKGDARYVRRGYGSIGCLSLMQNNSGQFMSQGETISASNLGFAYYGSTGVESIATAPSGTWMCLSGSDEGGLGLYERIS